MKKNIIKCFIIVLLVFFTSACNINEKFGNKDEIPNQENKQEEMVTLSHMRDLVTIPIEIQLLDEEKVISILTDPQEINQYMKNLYSVLSDNIVEYKSVHSPEKVIIKLLYADTRKVKITDVEGLEGRILEFNTIDIDNEGLIFLQLKNSNQYYMSFGKIELLSEILP